MFVFSWITGVIVRVSGFFDFAPLTGRAHGAHYTFQAYHARLQTAAAII